MELITGVALVTCGWLAFKGTQKAKYLHAVGKRVQQRETLATESLSNLERGLIKVNPNIVLKTDEHAVFSSTCTINRNVRNGTTFVGGSAGVRVAVAKGVSLSTSSNKGKSVANYDFEAEDGEIVITDTRIIFLGSSINFSVGNKELSNVVIRDNSVFFDISKSSATDFTVIFHNTQLVKHFSNIFAF
jgi:hypothetical protein